MSASARMVEMPPSNVVCGIAIHLDRIHLTFTEAGVDHATHRVDYRRGDIPITPPVREARRRLRAAKRAHRTVTHRRDRHPKTRWRIARATFHEAASRFFRFLLQRSHTPRRLSVPPSAAGRLAAYWERAQYRRWFMARFLRMKTPSTGIWDRVLKRGVPAMGALFSSIDFVKQAVWTQPQRRYARAIGYAGELTKYANSREGAWYRAQILAAQRRHRDFLEPPGSDPKDPYPEDDRAYMRDPAWRRRYEDWCIIRTAGLSLHQCPRCGWHFFTAQRTRPRCPIHPPVTLKDLKNLEPLISYLHHFVVARRASIESILRRDHARAVRADASRCHIRGHL